MPGPSLGSGSGGRVTAGVLGGVSEDVREADTPGVRVAEALEDEERGAPEADGEGEEDSPAAAPIVESRNSLERADDHPKPPPAANITSASSSSFRREGASSTAA
jgi:hypothetical protein